MLVSEPRILRASLRILAVLCMTWGFSLSMVLAANDSPQTFSVSGTLYQRGTSTPMSNVAVSMIVQILPVSDKRCLLYEEQQTVHVDAYGSFNIQVGSSPGQTQRTVSDPGLTMNSIFQNSSTVSPINSAVCAKGSFTPKAGESRVVRIKVSSGGAWDTLTPDFVMDSTPNALVAQSVQGLERSRILQVNTSGSTQLDQAKLESLFTTPSYTNLQSLLTGKLNFSQNVELPSPLAAPSTPPVAGALWYDLNDKLLKYSDGTNIISVSGSSGGSTAGTPGAGSVTSIATGTGLTGGPITGAGVISLAPIGNNLLLANTSGASAAPVPTSLSTLMGTNLTGLGALTIGAGGTGQFLNLNSSTTGSVNIGSGNGTQFSVLDNGASAVNYVTAKGAASGLSPVLGVAGSNANIDLNLSPKGSGNLIVTSGNVGIGKSSPGAPLDVKGAIRMSGSTSGYTGFQPAAAAGATVWTLPNTDGTDGQVLKTDGLGNLGWVSATGGAGGGGGGVVPTNTIPTYQVRAATTANITLSGTQTIDGVALIAGDRVLVKNQTTASENGIYVVASGAWTRASDMDTWAKTVGYSAVVSEGAVWSGSEFNSASTSVGTLNTTSINWYSKVRMDSQGRVGIGTTAPSSALEVNNGAIVSTSVTSTGSYINFGTSNVQMTSSTSSIINICGMKDGGTYTLILTGVVNNTTVTVNAYPTYVDTATCSGTAIQMDLGAGANTFTTSGNTNILSFIYIAGQGLNGTVYGVPATNYNY